MYLLWTYPLIFCMIFLLFFLHLPIISSYGLMKAYRNLFNNHGTTCTNGAIFKLQRQMAFWNLRIQWGMPESGIHNEWNGVGHRNKGSIVCGVGVAIPVLDADGAGPMGTSRQVTLCPRAFLKKERKKKKEGLIFWKNYGAQSTCFGKREGAFFTYKKGRAHRHLNEKRAGRIVT